MYNRAVSPIFAPAPCCGRRAFHMLVSNLVLARGRQWRIAWKMAVIANLRETEPLFSAILF